MSELVGSITPVLLSAAFRVLCGAQIVDRITGTHRVSEKGPGQLTVARHRVVARVRQHLYADVVGAGFQVGGEAGGDGLRGAVEDEGVDESVAAAASDVGAGEAVAEQVVDVGGDYTSPSARGVAYNPITNRWRRLPSMLLARAGFVAVWTGRQILVWSGLASSGAPSPHGQAYNPATNRWTALPTSPLRGRAAPAAVWTGRQMIIWGGYNYANGAAYTPSTP